MRGRLLMPVKVVALWALKRIFISAMISAWNLTFKGDTKFTAKKIKIKLDRRLTICDNS